MSSSLTEEIRKIGFNDTIQVERRTFHVQTEVLVCDVMTIQTTVLEAGVVKLAEARPCPTGSLEVALVREWVFAQHQHYLRQLHDREAPWLAST